MSESLLRLEDVSLRADGGRGGVVLAGVSLQVDSGELIAVWGARRSGRSSLLRVAAGIEPPHSGQVLLAGRSLKARGEALGEQIGWCGQSLKGVEAQRVIDELMAGQLGRGVRPGSARRRSLAALQRAGVEHCAARKLHELDSAEAVRVAIARAIVPEPALLVIDEPVKGVELLERDPILSLLRSLADEGLAVLMSAGEATALAGADRALSLTEGRLRGSLMPQLAPVVPLPSRRASA